MLNKIVSLLSVSILVGSASIAMEADFDDEESPFSSPYAMMSSGAGGPGPDPDPKEYFNFRMPEVELRMTSSFFDLGECHEHKVMMMSFGAGGPGPDPDPEECFNFGMPEVEQSVISSFFDLAESHELVRRCKFQSEPINFEAELEKQKKVYTEECQESCLPLVPTDVFPLIIQYLPPRDYVAFLLTAKRFYGIGCDKPVILMNLRCMIASQTLTNHHHLEMGNEFNDIEKDYTLLEKSAIDAKLIEFGDKYKQEIENLVYAARFYMKIYKNPTVLCCERPNILLSFADLTWSESSLPSRPLRDLDDSYQNCIAFFREINCENIFPSFKETAFTTYSICTRLPRFNVQLNHQPLPNFNLLYNIFDITQDVSDLFIRVDEDDNQDEEKSDEGDS